MCAADVREAIDAYHALLSERPQLAAESARRLIEDQPGRCLTFGERQLCGVLRPQFLAPETYARIQGTCTVLAGAMFRLADTMLNVPALLEPLHLTAEERDLVSIDPGFREVSPTTRLDSFMAGDSWKFVEYNAETPAAVAYEDILSGLFAELPIMQAFGERYQVSALPARAHLLRVLLDAYRQWGGRGAPTIGIIDWAGLPTTSEFELFKRYFDENGIDAVIATPADLEYDGARLSAEGQPIDLVYRRVLTAELLQHPEVARPLVKAYRDHAVCVVNSFRSKLLHKKMIFALLSDERYAEYFGPDERAVIAQHIPWTRQVRDGYTTHEGRRVDLLPFIAEHRTDLVLKPNDEYGGKGVVVGWEATPEEWETAIREAVETPSVVQERVPVDRVPFPVADGEEFVLADMTPDLDPFLFQTEVGGVLTRLSSGGLLNVTAGTGSVAPTFLVEPR